MGGARHRRQVDVILDGGPGSDIADRDRTDPAAANVEILI
jgi:hypothetical protein